jgi:hypothetical protein
MINSKMSALETRMEVLPPYGLDNILRLRHRTLQPLHVKSTRGVHHTISDFDENFNNQYTAQTELLSIFVRFLCQKLTDLWIFEVLWSLATIREVAGSTIFRRE